MLPGLTLFSVPNGISIGSVIFAGRTIDRPIDRPRYSICNNRPHLKVKQGRPIEHQASTVNLTRWTEATWTKNTWKSANCLQVCSQKVFKCPPFAWTHAWRCFLHWSIALSITYCRKSDHRPALLNCKALSLLRTVNKQKVKCWYFA